MKDAGTTRQFVGNLIGIAFVLLVIVISVLGVLGLVGGGGGRYAVP